MSGKKRKVEKVGKKSSGKKWKRQGMGKKRKYLEQL